jgi:type IV pilus assembly protein PilM
LTNSSPARNGILRLGLLRRVGKWLNAMPHPSFVIEIASDHVAAARWGKVRGNLESYAIEPLGIGSIAVSPVEPNVAKPDAVRAALRRTLGRAPLHGGPVALLIPDPAMRVFIFPLDNLPRRADEALPLLRWRLKKSVPFDVEETVVSWMRQKGRDGNPEVVTAVARQRIVREYEEIVESVGANAGVVLSSTLASLPLMDERGATLLVRASGRTMTTVIVNGSSLAVFRSTEMPVDSALFEPKVMLDEIYPAAAFYQDTWGGAVDRARLAGFGAREDVFRRALVDEMKISAGPLADAVGTQEFAPNVKDLIRHDLDALVGWTMNAGS